MSKAGCWQPTFNKDEEPFSTEGNQRLCVQAAGSQTRRHLLVARPPLSLSQPCSGPSVPEWCPQAESWEEVGHLDTAHQVPWLTKPALPIYLEPHGFIILYGASQPHKVGTTCYTSLFTPLKAYMWSTAFPMLHTTCSQLNLAAQVSSPNRKRFWEPDHAVHTASTWAPWISAGLLDSLTRISHEKLHSCIPWSFGHI